VWREDEPGYEVTALHAALTIHAVAASMIFAVLSLVYFHQSASWSPLRTAAAFLGVVVIMDTFVVATVDLLLSEPCLLNVETKEDLLHWFLERKTHHISPVLRRSSGLRSPQETNR
jgi:uncharacterized membrane protein